MAGKNFKISETNNNLPQMQGALEGWEIPVYANYIEQEQDEYGNIIENSYTKTIYGVRQPFKLEELNLLPEGNRSFSHYWLHVDIKYPQLHTQQIVTIRGRQHRVVSVHDYSLDGYIAYHLTEDYQEGQ